MSEEGKVEEGKRKKKKRGFACMDPEKQREIARKGGITAHKKGKAHKFTQEEARIAGRKGGRAAQDNGTAHRWDSEAARIAAQKRNQS